MTNKIQREALIEALQEHAPRALHVAEICGRIGVAKSRKDEVLDELDDLRRMHLVTEMPGNRFRLKRRSVPRGPSPAPVNVQHYGLVIGRLSINRRGFAFVSPEDGSADVFIPPTGMGAALHGDRVEVQARPSAKGREGRVAGVLERRPPRFTGQLQRRGRTVWIEPDDPRLRSPIAIEGELPGNGKLRGEAVIAEFVAFPQDDNDTPSAKVVDILGIAGMTEVEVAKIKIRDNVLEEFGQEVLEEAEAIPNRVLQREKRDREDLRDLDLCTIDPPDARDHDDALWIERKGRGFKVVVAIADVAHYVRPGTAIDRAALERCTSIYLPDRAIPMLPPELSTDLASLVPNKDRLCMAVEIELGPSGAIRKHRLMEGVMRSRAKLTYAGVARALGLTNEGPRQQAATKRLPMLEAMLDLSRALRRKRLRRGALDFDLPEARVRLDDANVEPIDVYRSRTDPGVREAYRIVEEMMLLANEVVAAELKDRGVPAIYRLHGQPDGKKIEAFAELAQHLGYDMNATAAGDPRQLSAFLTKIDGTEQAPVLRFLLLRAMQQAVYDTSPDVGHFGLATKDYLHFTSPIRRYPDLAVHRVVKSVLRGQTVDRATLRPKLRRQAVESSRLERRAMNVERDVVDLYRCILMRDRVGEDFSGYISSVDSHGFRVAFDEPFVEATVSVDVLRDDYYSLDDLGIRLRGQRNARAFGLGDRIEVRLEEVSISNREMKAVPVDLADRDFDMDRPPRRRNRRSEEAPSRYAKSRRTRDERPRRSRDEERPRRRRSDDEAKPRRTRTAKGDTGEAIAATSHKGKKPRKKKEAFGPPKSRKGKTKRRKK